LTDSDAMTKAEFIDQVADRAGLSRKEASDAVDAVLKTIEDTLRRGGEVTFSGFGKFSVADRGARKGRNPQTGERMQIAATRVPRFQAGSGLKRVARTLGGSSGRSPGPLPGDSDTDY
jgi:DNA-binding protein HU-beta